MENKIGVSEQIESERFISRSMLVKFGTEAITGGDSSIDREFILNAATQISELFHAGVKILVVTSGAVGCGKKHIKGYDLSMLHKQMAAASGQIELISAWQESFAQFGIPVFQVLVTANTLKYVQEVLLEMM